MKVLVACEFSGTVRNEFLALGHDAYSCDVLPTTAAPHDRHYQKDVTGLLCEPWDLVIAHPPCTYLTKLGARWRTADPNGRRIKMLEAIEFFLACLNANSPRVCVENPRPYREVVDRVGEPTQVVCPSEFGDTNTKTTCLWLRGLEPLVPTCEKRKLVDGIPGRRDATVRVQRGPHTGLIRSITSKHLAMAMANQWGER